MFVVTVIAVAYGSAAPELGIAEFAPAAQTAATAPPSTAGGADEHSARSGRRSTTTTSLPPTTPGTSVAAGGPAPPTTLVARGRPCFGEPPRQTADPQSPPCRPTLFEGDNGGMTSMGVTGTEIKVAITLPAAEAVHAPLFEYFNRSYELYGRRLVPVFTGSPDLSTPANARAAATAIAGQQVFATLPRSPIQFSSFYQELARQGVLAVVPRGGALLEDRTLFDPLHPYVWSVYPSVEDVSRNVGALACNALVGRPAVAARGPLKDLTRSFGIIATGQASPMWSIPLEESLSTCGVSPMIRRLVDTNSTDDRRVALQAFKDAGVTTIACLCHVNLSIDLNLMASKTVGYQPEWLQVAHTAADDLMANFFEPAAPELFQMLEVTPAERMLPMQARPSFRALVEMAPALPNPDRSHNTAQFLYQQLAVLAAGIQAAGPTLTPETFASGLMATSFANTGAGQAPFWQPRVGFGPGDHSFFSDYAIAWWSMDAQPYDGAAPVGRGSWCYVGRGERFRPGAYPLGLGDRLFSATEACR